MKRTFEGSKAQLQSLDTKSVRILRKFALFSSSSSRLKDRASPPRSPPNDLARQKLAQREFFLSVLSTATTKREVKGYLSRFKNASSNEKLQIADRVHKVKSEVAGVEKNNAWQSNKSGVNLGSLYEATRAIGDSPVFTHRPLPERLAAGTSEPLHVAVVKIRAPESLDKETLNGVGLNLAQLAWLGLLSVVVVDCENAEMQGEPTQTTQRWRAETMEQCARVTNAIKIHSKTGARVVEQLLTVNDLQKDLPRHVHVRGGVEVGLREMLLTPLRSGTIPVIPPFAYGVDSNIRRVQPDEVVLALTRELAGLTALVVDELQPQKSIDDWKIAPQSIRDAISLDRIIILDPLGGLPAAKDPEQSHIFVNLEQEYSVVREVLLDRGADSHAATIPSTTEENYSLLGGSNPLSRFLGNGVGPPSAGQVGELHPLRQRTKINRHVKNLDLVQRCLALLPPSSSALLTTPAEAASSACSNTSKSESTVMSVSTRRKRNPLIHNLLTDKPIISSSLPAARMSTPSITVSPSTAHPTPATFFKRGMPITIIPDPRTSPWEPLQPGSATLHLESDPRVDFPRLLYLIEDSFGRKLDVQHYLSRIKDKIAGIIIAGEYEGGAILTWESPFHDAKSGHTRPPVPYLDKFAVLRRSQGSGGVADVVFNAMVKDCFPAGVVWRSRRDNPVNKWYFERSVGTWKVPNTQWTMFWTGNDLDSGQSSETEQNTDENVSSKREMRWRDFVKVCESIQASWADAKPPD